MAGRRAAARGRARRGVNKRLTAGSKRKAQDVLCTEHNNANTTSRQAAAQFQSQQTMESVRASFQQEVRSASRATLPLLHRVHYDMPSLQASKFEAKIQEQSVAELAGLTAMEHDLKQHAKVQHIH